MEGVGGPSEQRRTSYVASTQCDLGCLGQPPGDSGDAADGVVGSDRLHEYWLGVIHPARAAKGGRDKCGRIGNLERVTHAPKGIECIILRLRDGRTTTIPVQLIAADKDDLARDIRAHLERAAR